MTLTEFLLARIAEDEAPIVEMRAEYPGVFESDNLRPWQSDWGNVEVCQAGVRALAECEAKRRIVDLHFDMSAAHNDAETKMMMDAGLTVGPDDLYSSTCNECAPHAAEFPCSTLRALTLPYAEHPDYRQGWAI